MVPPTPPCARSHYSQNQLPRLAGLQVLHLELDIAGSGMRYAPGDAIGVLPQNDAALVSALLERLGLEGEAVFDVASADEEEAAQGGSATGGGEQGGGGPAQQQQPAHHHSTEHLLPHLRAPCTVRSALSTGVDLTGPPRKSLLRLLAEHCSAAGERRRLLRLCSRDGREAYAAELAARPTLLDLLAEHPSCRPPLAALLDALPPLAARMYSLTCSPLESPDRVSWLPKDVWLMARAGLGWQSPCSSDALAAPHMLPCFLCVTGGCASRFGGQCVQASCRWGPRP